MQKLLLFLFLSLFYFQLTAQIKLDFSEGAPYKVEWKKEIPIGLLGAGMLITADVLKNKTSIFTLNELALLDAENINSFDRIATTYYSTKIQKASDYLWYSSHSLPFLFLASPKTRKDFIPIGGMYSEALLMSVGATLLCKYSFRRNRPYLYNETVNLDIKQQKDAKASFVSGHTSVVATNTFFAARVFSDYFPDSKWKPAIWTSAAILPAVTGYLRVRGGKHYPTDVIGGYLLGASIGYFIPKIHNVLDLEGKGISVNVGLESMQVVWVFDK